MSRHRRIERLRGPIAVALAVCACAAVGGEPHLTEPSRAPREGRVVAVPRAAHREPQQIAPALAAPAVEPPLETAPLETPALDAQPAAAPLAGEGPEPVVEWRFRSAAPLCGAPAVSSSGLVYLASVEGFVHALAPDGAYRWSHAVTGMPVGSPAVDPSGHVFVATTAQRLYAFKPDGRLSWMHRSRSRFASSPMWAAPGLIYYAGRDRNLYSIAAWGSATHSHGLGSPANGELASVGEGAVAIGLETPEAQVFRRSSPLARIELPAPPTQPLLGGSGHWYVVTRAGLAALDASTHAPLWTAPAERAGLSPDERALVVETEGDLVWLEPGSGAELHRVQLPEHASAAPTVTNSGIAFVPLVSGGVLVVDARGARLARVGVARAPAWPAVWSEARRRVTLAAAGDVIGIDLSGWVAPLHAASDGEPGARTPSQPSRERRGEAGRDGVESRARHEGR